MPTAIPPLSPKTRAVADRHILPAHLAAVPLGAGDEHVLHQQLVRLARRVARGGDARDPAAGHGQAAVRLLDVVLAVARARPQAQHHLLTASSQQTQRKYM